MWQEKLPRQIVEYVETVCMPEMRLLGYEPHFCRKFDPEVVRSFRDPFPEIHAKFPADYSHDPVRVDNEIERLRKLAQDLGSAEQRKWFLNENTYRILRENVAAQGKGLATD